MSLPPPKTTSTLVLQAIDGVATAVAVASMVVIPAAEDTVVSVDTLPLVNGFVVIVAHATSMVAYAGHWYAQARLTATNKL